MEFNAQLDALQCSRYEIDGNKGGNMMALGEKIENENLVGKEVIKYACPYDLFTQIGASLPAKLDCVMTISQAGGNKGKVVIKSAKLAGQPK
ncbi:MAG: hypothetical protein GYB21_01000 [Oceanospirillales bacterium]|nr:hypothetical protein [Oceanospirillales bacterium]